MAYYSSIRLHKYMPYENRKVYFDNLKHIIQVLRQQIRGGWGVKACADTADEECLRVFQ